MSRFVTPDIKVLKISQGDTLTVKRRLNSGEQRAMFTRIAVAGADGTMKLNQFQMGVSAIVSYLVDWSLVGDDGKIVAIRDQPSETVTAALDALDPESFAEIREAIEAHDAEVRGEREKEKNDRGTASESSATSPLPASATGDTNGSANLTLMSTTSS